MINVDTQDLKMAPKLEKKLETYKEKVHLFYNTIAKDIDKKRVSSFDEIENLNAKLGKNKKTLLMFACDKANIEVVEALLALGADKTIVSDTWTAKRYISQYIDGKPGKKEILELLSDEKSMKPIVSLSAGAALAGGGAVFLITYFAFRDFFEKEPGVTLMATAFAVILGAVVGGVIGTKVSNPIGQQPLVDTKKDI